ncbi:MAG: hypothetical protein GY722_08150 [bacterium]|nr:hypothetical protein [bacterium]
MQLIQPRTDIGLVVLIVGYLLYATFGLSYGLVLAAIGLGVAAYSILGGANPGKIMLATLVLVSAGSLWLVASTNSGPSEPPSLDTVTEFAEEYRAALANGDFEAYLGVAHSQVGLTREQAFAVETQCLDWHQTQIAVAPQGVSPFFAVVTFSVDDMNLVRQFGYEAEGNEWTVQVQTDC